MIEPPGVYTRHAPGLKVQKPQGYILSRSPLCSARKTSNLFLQGNGSCEGHAREFVAVEDGNWPSSAYDAEVRIFGWANELRKTIGRQLPKPSRTKGLTKGAFKPSTSAARQHSLTAFTLALLSITIGHNHLRAHRITERLLAPKGACIGLASPWASTFTPTRSTREVKTTRSDTVPFFFLNVADGSRLLAGAFLAHLFQVARAGHISVSGFVLAAYSHRNSE
ncbi:hypothetical protein WG66_005285 [Moniliophthora roreri]|nr:hypothetical protein WG66_005285 [Moniliophthora roreri]